MPTFTIKSFADEILMKDTRKVGFDEVDSTRSLETLSMEPGFLASESVRRSLLNSINEGNRIEHRLKSGEGDGDDDNKEKGEKDSENEQPLLPPPPLSTEYSTKHSPKFSTKYSHSLDGNGSVQSVEISVQSMEMPAEPFLNRRGSMMTVDFESLESADKVFRKQSTQNVNDSPFSYMFKNAEQSRSKKPLNLNLLGIILAISILCFILGLVTGIMIKTA